MEAQIEQAWSNNENVARLCVGGRGEEMDFDLSEMRQISPVVRKIKRTESSLQEEGMKIVDLNKLGIYVNGGTRMKR